MLETELKMGGAGLGAVGRGMLSVRKLRFIQEGCAIES